MCMIREDIEMVVTLNGESDRLSRHTVEKSPFLTGHSTSSSITSVSTFCNFYNVSNIISLLFI